MAEPEPLRVLLVTRNLPPLIGGMERLIAHVAEQLARRYRTTVIGPRGCAALLPASVGASEVPLSPLWKFLLASAWRTLREARRRRPRVILAGSGVTAPMAWLAARLSGARCAVYLHGLDLVAASPVYQRLWLPLIRRQDLCIVNSSYSRGLALAAGVPERALQVLNPGVDLPAEPGAGDGFRDELALGGGPLLLYVGRLTPRKGLLEFLRLVLPGLLAADPSLRLAVIGEEASNAIGGGAAGYLAQVRAVIAELGLGHAVRLLGGCPDPLLFRAYAAADALVFPVIERANDPEGFGMVAVEAAARGVPTVAFAVGGLVDAVADGTSGVLVKSGDYAAFTAAVFQALRLAADPAARQRCREFAAGFRWEAFGERLSRMLERLAAGAAS
jgi:phosphatidylinositol alpha-1,6-mannosyltransferase